MLKIRYAKKSGMLKNRYAKKPVWLLDTWAWAHGPGRMGRRRPAARPPGRRRRGRFGWGGGGAGPAAAAGRPGGGGPCAQGHGPMPMCPGAKALAHEYFDIWAHKYF